jgi:hypothetical protein
MMNRWLKKSLLIACIAFIIQPLLISPVNAIAMFRGTFPKRNSSRLDSRMVLISNWQQNKVLTSRFRGTSTLAHMTIRLRACGAQEPSCGILKQEKTLILLRRWMA